MGLVRASRRLGLALVLVLAGCGKGGSTEHFAQAASSPTSPSTATPSSSSATTGQTATWSGTWDSHWNGGSAVITFTQNGDHVDGTYTDQDGRITGRVIGPTLVGTWSQAPTRQPPNQEGDLLFILHGTKFTGRWQYGHQAQLLSWDGSCTAGPCRANR